MGIFLVYILKSAACLAVFYLFYKLLMSRDTFHRFNRFALLGLLVLSSLLPLVEVSVEDPAPVHETMLTLEQLLMLASAGEGGEAAVDGQPATVGWISRSRSRETSMWTSTIRSRIRASCWASVSPGRWEARKASSVTVLPCRWMRRGPRFCWISAAGTPCSGMFRSRGSMWAIFRRR